MINVTLITNNPRRQLMVSEDQTIREILDENGINYSIGLTQLDGCSLRPGDMDKTFAEHGIVDSCYLSCVVKADNAAKVTVIGAAAVVTSGLKLEDIKMAKKYRPEALKLWKDEKKNEQIFGVDVTCRSSGSINNNGATFSEVTDRDGYATLTMPILRDDDVEKTLSDDIGIGLIRLNELEQKFGGVIDEIAAEQETIRQMIQVC